MVGIVWRAALMPSYFWEKGRQKRKTAILGYRARQIYKFSLYIKWSKFVKGVVPGLTHTVVGASQELGPYVTW